MPQHFPPPPRTWMWALRSQNLLLPCISFFLFFPSIHHARTSSSVGADSGAGNWTWNTSHHLLWITVPLWNCVSMEMVLLVWFHSPRWVYRFRKRLLRPSQPGKLSHADEPRFFNSSSLILFAKFGAIAHQSSGFHRKVFFFFIIDDNLWNAFQFLFPHQSSLNIIKFHESSKESLRLQDETCEWRETRLLFVGVLRWVLCLSHTSWKQLVCQIHPRLQQ